MIPAERDRDPLGQRSAGWYPVDLARSRRTNRAHYQSTAPSVGMKWQKSKNF